MRVCWGVGRTIVIVIRLDVIERRRSLLGFGYDERETSLAVKI
jgi:hypothetical protein